MCNIISNIIITNCRSPLDTPTSASKTTPTSSSARKKRRKRGSGTKETPRQLFSPVTSPEPTLLKCENDELDCLDKIITDFVLQESTKDNNDNNEQRDVDHKMADIGKIEISHTECQTSCSTGTVNGNRGTLHGGTEETGRGYDEGMNEGLERWGTAVGTRSLRPWGNRKNRFDKLEFITKETHYNELVGTSAIIQRFSYYRGWNSTVNTVLGPVTTCTCMSLIIIEVFFIIMDVLKESGSTVRVQCIIVT